MEDQIIKINVKHLKVMHKPFKKANICFRCRNPADFSEMDELERKEYELSAMCKKCQDVCFHNHNDPDNVDLYGFNKDMNFVLNLMGLDLRIKK